jgi:molybdopterin-containing oxidoreductase family iron-sulfur binding subunit
MDNHHSKESNVENTASQTFVPPRHWIGPEELEASYWSDPQIREKRGQEFFEKPVELIDQIDRIDKKGIARRDFLTIMGASMAMASFACARRPVNKIIPYVVKPEEITPGVATWYASTCPECGTDCGILIKNREGRPIKLEGNPDHPINRGTLCSRGQASLLNLYDPDRLKAPLIRSRTNGGSHREASWKDVDSAIQAKLKSVAAGAGRVRVLTGEMSSESTRRLIREFLSVFRNGKHVEFEPLSLSELSDAQGLSYGTELVPQYRFDLADFVVSLGADFLGNWVSPVEHARAWAKKRTLEGQDPAHAKISKLVSFESNLTSTGANSDERYLVRPGDELKVALALAHELIVSQKRSQLAKESSILAALEGYKPETVAAEIGMENGAAQIKKIANELWANRGKSLVVGGSVQTKTQEAVALQVAVNLLNSALENDGTTIDGTVNFSQPRSGYTAMSQLISDMKAGQVDALIIYRSNPAYTLPRAVVGLEEAMKRVPLIIVVADHDDETAHFADFVLADHHYLENWGDANPRKGLYSLQQPAMAPIHSTRAFQDSLLVWAKALNASGMVARSPDWHEYLRNHWKETHFKEISVAGTFDQFWDGTLRTGVFDVRAAQGAQTKPSARSFRSASVAQLPKYSAKGATETLLVLYAKVSMHDGRHANNAWLQEMPDPISSVTWDNYLNVSPALAKKLDVRDDDVVEIRSGDVIAQLPVHVQPGMHPQVVSAAVGYGRRSVGKVGNLAGVDVFPFVRADGGRLLFAGQSVSIHKTGKFYKLASTQWHTTTESRPIINDITLAQYRKNPTASMHTDPHLRLDAVPSLWPAHEYKSYRWGMAIDLNSCFGCGACVIACQAENNVPVVGRDQVRVARQMHWLRIDRYYSGTPENPDVVFQPMLCQHCENAPCETVCPVLATVHDDEGLNAQVYNRCVGTRYCQNNCPYKVRRFNFFDHWKSYEGTMNMVWNPDVTVRTRGIMEKCTFCVQRIRDAKDKAKDAGERVHEGDFQTACQQTCPSGAIVFGDMNDPKSRLSKMKESPQAFRVLEVLNTKPSISYMTKVRNKAEKPHSADGAEHHA